MKLRTLEAHYATTPLMTIEGTMQISGVPAKIWFDAYVKRRDSLKIVLTGPFGIPVGALAATSATLEFYSPEQNAVLVGRPDRETFRKMIMVDIEYDEIVALLRGEIPHLPKPGEYRTEQSGAALTYIVERDDVEERFTLGVDDIAIRDYRRTRRTEAGLRTELSIRYENMRRLGGRSMPTKATVEIADATQKIWITVDRVTDELDAASLALDVPPSIERRRL